MNELDSGGVAWCGVGASYNGKRIDTLSIVGFNKFSNFTHFKSIGLIYLIDVVDTQFNPK